jgi:hypothetical protein
MGVMIREWYIPNNAGTEGGTVFLETIYRENRILSVKRSKHRELHTKAEGKLTGTTQPSVFFSPLQNVLSHTMYVHNISVVCTYWHSTTNNCKFIFFTKTYYKTSAL